MVRNYCQPVWRSRASLPGRSNTFKCKWTPLLTSITFTFNFAFCLSCLTSDNLSVYVEIRTVPHWLPCCSCPLVQCLSVNLYLKGHTKLFPKNIYTSKPLSTCKLAADNISMKLWICQHILFKKVSTDMLRIPTVHTDV